jgi:hypothetical protein
MQKIIYVYVILFLFLFAFLMNRQSKRGQFDDSNRDYDVIQEYLLTDTDTLDKTKKPIIWIPIYYEYNSRNWLSFGSRSSTNLNQPYLYLTIKSIIANCDSDFTVCLIDDHSFDKLLPDWNVDMAIISDPILSYMRLLGMTQLIYRYGGMVVPPSFLSMKNMIDLYYMGTMNEKMFVCENIDRSITSTTQGFSPDVRFMGATKENQTVQEFVDFIRQIISRDATDQAHFLGMFNGWLNNKVQKGQVNLIDGKLIGVKTTSGEPILVDHLLNNEYIPLSMQSFGILIPSDEILNRTRYNWFARMSVPQVLESNTIVGKYLLVSTGNMLQEPMISKPKKWIGYWQVPSGFGLWGMKPTPFATHLTRTDTDPKP